MKRRVLIIIPALNEALSITKVLDELRTTCPEHDVLVVDDGSSDATGAVAAAAGAAVLRLPYNLGVGGAMRAGYRYARERGYTVAVQVDADGQHDTAYVPALIELLERADVAIGARFAGTGTYSSAGLPRRVAMWLLAKVLSVLAGTRMTDVTSGFRACNARAIAVFATHYPVEYLGDTVESLVIALRSNCVVRQVPVVMRARREGRASQSTARSLVYLARVAVALGLALVRRWEPVETASEGVRA
ncbi:glycosyltransferase family 2 protein [Nonomuraea africana]|uniref:Glycosyltransferase involved in cell wall biosynthesis n=1 Tax=Nonomuraea africana TaxID=46171 RepID=A0ABR9KVD1_9ACTN|nr:glycosyltransferase family 2 protein [Nonomuraea africana]MBE1565482.1 glycosyltransferase involved in cell wall biosynthesis [Nonomuraea africana]